MRGNTEAPFHVRALAKLGSGYSLRSGFGPIASFLYSRDWVVEGVGGFSQRRIKVRFEGAYRFDLVSYLEQSGQDGTLWAAVAQVSEELAGVPTRSKGTPTFDELRRTLSDQHCTPGDWGSFWVDKWDGVDTAVLVVEVCQPISMRSASSMSAVAICIKVPAEWKPWLSQVDGETAVLGEGIEQRALSPSRSAMAKARQTLTRLPRRQRRAWVARHWAQSRPLSASGLLEQFFPWAADSNVDTETQWAALDRVKMLGRVGQNRACLDAAAPFFGTQPVPYALAVGVVKDFSRCAGNAALDAQLAACARAPEPLACARPAYQYALGQWAASAAEAAKQPFCPVNPIANEY